MPQRIQLRRTKGWRKPEGAVVVSRPSIWGNPHPGSRWDDPPECAPGPWPTWAHFAVECYRRWLAGEPTFMRWWRGTLWGCVEQMADPPDPSRTAILSRLHELRGKDLCCWCPLDQPCHADVLLELANKETA